MLTLATNIWGSYIVALRTLAIAILCGIIGREAIAGLRMLRHEFTGSFIDHISTVNMVDSQFKSHGISALCTKIRTELLGYLNGSASQVFEPFQTICLRTILFVSKRCIDGEWIMSRGEFRVRVIGLKSLSSRNPFGGSDSDHGDVHHVATAYSFLCGQRTASLEAHMVTRKCLWDA
jgi:hypothetical protein